MQDFWRRWHITLSRWIRDFLFHPIAVRGSRSAGATALKLVAVMLLVGLWHGAAWTFVIWGGLHGLFLAAERFTRERRRAAGRRAQRAVRGGGRSQPPWSHSTSSPAAWVFFRADSVEHALDVFSRLGSPGPSPAIDPLLLGVIATSLAVQFVAPRWTRPVVAGFARLRPAVQSAALALALLAVDALGPQGVPPFIYFRF